MNELNRLTATAAVSYLHTKELSPLDLVDAAIERIEAVDGHTNALPIRCFERAREQAAKHGKDGARSLLGGLPIAVKDYNDVGGVRTTFGSPIFANNVAAQSDTTVSRLETNGAIPIAKANVPEWAGGHTFNPVNGITRNPWDTRLSAGGSSGGCAAALASGQVWLATGNDLGGSLRTPASFNGVVGLRPSPGLVPRPARNLPFDVLWVEGPMGRCVRDVALMLDAQAGLDLRDPLSFDGKGVAYANTVERDLKPLRVAFSPDLGVVPMTAAIADTCAKAAARFADLGAEVTGDAPDFSGSIDGFQTLRAALMAAMMGPMLTTHRDRIAPEIIGNIERGLNLSIDEVLLAERQRMALYQRVSAFFQTHDLLICPAASITPFAAEARYAEEIDGQPCETYIDWFSITFAVTMTSCPTISLPCGFSRSGMPIGMQIMGQPRGERELLAAAFQLEQLLGIHKQVPIEPRVHH
ncbi:MAG: amidase [Gammaproteobacteria bacterium]|nr:amidase [Gammaproteobacteria bacterium]